MISLWLPINIYCLVILISFWFIGNFVLYPYIKGRQFWFANLWGLCTSFIVNSMMLFLFDGWNWAFKPMNCWQAVIFFWLLLLLLQGFIRFFAMIYYD